MLDLGYCLHESSLVMVVHHSNNTLTLSFDIVHPLIVGNLGADCIADSLRARGISAFVNDGIKLVQKVFRQRNADTGELRVAYHT